MLRRKVPIPPKDVHRGGQEGEANGHKLKEPFWRGGRLTNDGPRRAGQCCSAEDSAGQAKFEEEATLMVGV